MTGHGDVPGYRRGCRCDACRAANAEYQRSWRAKNRAKRREPVSHGRNGYSNYGCKCPSCWAPQKANSDRFTTSDQRRVDREAKRKYHQQRDLETARGATRHGYQWTGPELEIAARVDLTPMEKAAMLGRTLRSVETVMWKIRRGEPIVTRLAGKLGGLAS